MRKIYVISIIMAITIVLSACGKNQSTQDVRKNASQGTQVGKESAAEESFDDSLLYLEPLKIEIDQEADIDGDTLTGIEELEYGTYADISDTDHDGLSDGEEVRKTKTDPVNEDTDNDGVTDAQELLLGLDPLKERTDGKTIDGERFYAQTFTPTLKETEEMPANMARLEVEGKASSMDILIRKSEDVNIRLIPGAVSDLYELHEYGKTMPEHIQISIPYDKKTVLQRDLKVFRLLDDGTYEEVGGCVNKEKGTVEAKLNHFSNYFVADAEVIGKTNETDVMFLIDDSASMYSMEYLNGLHKDMYVDADGLGNDTEYKRADMIDALVDRFDDNVYSCVATFRDTTTYVVEEFTNDKRKLHLGIGSIKKESDPTMSGTNIYGTMWKEALKLGKRKDARHFMVVLTDGVNSPGFGATTMSKESVVSTLVRYNTAAIMIGLGNDVNASDMQYIAKETGGIYVWARDADALDKIYDRIMLALNLNMENGEILIADSGFNAQRDGWHFKNFVYKSNTEQSDGQCRGMSSVACLYYMNKLPLTMDKREPHKAGGWFSSSTLQSDGYDATNISYIKNGSNLYSYMPYGDTFDKLTKSTATSYVRSGDDLRYKDEILKTVDQNPYLSIQTRTANTTWKEGDGKQIKDYDQFVVDVSSSQNGGNTDLSDFCNTIKMIHWWHNDQGEGSRLSNLVIGQGGYGSEQNGERFDMLVDLLNSGQPVVISCPSKGHAINAVKLYRNADDPKRYRLVVYDNNHPGEEKSIVIEKDYRASFETVMVGAEYNIRIYDEDRVFTKENEKKDLLSLKVEYLP